MSSEIGYLNRASQRIVNLFTVTFQMIRKLQVAINCEVEIADSY
jgi:hypothetical protein